jgi:hypothetical protein
MKQETNCKICKRAEKPIAPWNNFSPIFHHVSIPSTKISLIFSNIFVVGGKAFRVLSLRSGRSIDVPWHRTWTPFFLCCCCLSADPKQYEIVQLVQCCIEHYWTLYCLSKTLRVGQFIWIMSVWNKFQQQLPALRDTCGVPGLLLLGRCWCWRFRLLRFFVFGVFLGVLSHTRITSDRVEMGGVYPQLAQPGTEFVSGSASAEFSGSSWMTCKKIRSFFFNDRYDWPPRWQPLSP